MGDHFDVPDIMASRAVGCEDEKDNQNCRKMRTDPVDWDEALGEF